MSGPSHARDCLYNMLSYQYSHPQEEVPLEQGESLYSAICRGDKAELDELVEYIQGLGQFDISDADHYIQVAVAWLQKDITASEALPSDLLQNISLLSRQHLTQQSNSKGEASSASEKKAQFSSSVGNLRELFNSGDQSTRRKTVGQREIDTQLAALRGSGIVKQGKQSIAAAFEQRMATKELSKKTSAIADTAREELKKLFGNGSSASSESDPACAIFDKTMGEIEEGIQGDFQQLAERLAELQKSKNKPEDWVPEDWDLDNFEELMYYLEARQSSQSLQIIYLQEIEKAVRQAVEGKEEPSERSRLGKESLWKCIEENKYLAATWKALYYPFAECINSEDEEEKAAWKIKDVEYKKYLGYPCFYKHCDSFAAKEGTARSVRRSINALIGENMFTGGKLPYSKRPARRGM